MTSASAHKSFAGATTGSVTSSTVISKVPTSEAPNPSTTIKYVVFGLTGTSKNEQIPPLSSLSNNVVAPVPSTKYK
jgi:hypothetical protein